MERINSHNYEAFFLDYLEGNLSAQQEFELFDFLDKNPGFRTELGVDLNEVTLQPLSTPAFDKGGLKKTGIQPDEVDDLMIASVEGQLSASDTSALESYVDANGLSAQYRHYQNTVLQPDLTIGYSNKVELKKRDRFFIPLWTKFAAAGVGVVLVGITATQFRDNTPQLADQHKEANITVPATDENLQISNDPQNVKLIVEEEETPALTETVKAENINSFTNGKRTDHPIKTKVESPDFIPDLNTTLTQESEGDEDKIKKGSEDKIESEKPVEEIEEEQPEELIQPKERIKSKKEYEEEKGKIITEEPIKVVTNFAEKVFKKDVSYERDKDTGSGKFVGHHVKLGRFEFERKK